MRRLGSVLTLAVMLGGLAGAHGRPGPAAQNIVNDSFWRVIAAAGKVVVPCPEQDERTAVILAIGQSNSSNWGECPYHSEYGASVVNFFDGNCFIASSPLLGADGSLGEPWTALGNRLIESETFERVILVASGIGGSSVAQWQSGGRVNAMLMNVLPRMQPYYRITHVLWHQGEADHTLQTSSADYARSFMSLVASLRARGISAPIYVSVASRCRESLNSPDESAIAKAQRALVSPAQNILAGVDTDRLIGIQDRWDGCHLGAVGQARLVEAWLAILRR